MTDELAPESDLCQDVRAEIRTSALRLLARREYARGELRLQLLRRHGRSREPLVSEIIDDLAGAGLQSDARFVEGFIRHRADQCYGPLRIRQELGARGIDPERIDAGMRECGVCWGEGMEIAWRKKFGSTPSRHAPDLHKQAQFLLYRGFEVEAIRELLGAVDSW